MPFESSGPAHEKSHPQCSRKEPVRQHLIAVLERGVKHDKVAAARELGALGAENPATEDFGD
jgi:hypothetical protein